ncbi:hypothetical protein KEM54_005376 [Ascosphaera aggregata]|nr:hypothetical protein KEM54_005376 [Ascosphaera aggregata]
MDHSMHFMNMGHDGHGGHDGMGMSSKCKMNMLFTWSTEDLCIVFPQWHIYGPWSLLSSLFAIVLLTAGYEALRRAAQRYEAKQLGASKDGALSATDNFTSYRDNSVEWCDPEIASRANHGHHRDEEYGTCDASTVQTAVASGSQHGSASNRAGTVNLRQCRYAKITLAAFYAAQVFYSFFIM